MIPILYRVFANVSRICASIIRVICQMTRRTPPGAPGQGAAPPGGRKKDAPSPMDKSALDSAGCHAVHELALGEEEHDQRREDGDQRDRHDAVPGEAGVRVHAHAHEQRRRIAGRRVDIHKVYLSAILDLCDRRIVP